MNQKQMIHNEVDSNIFHEKLSYIPWVIVCVVIWMFLNNEFIPKFIVMMF